MDKETEILDTPTPHLSHCLYRPQINNGKIRIMQNNNKQIIVIGAGAAGMMAAGRAAECGANVLLLEKTTRPGQKILISGNGRCNLTNSGDFDTFIAHYGTNGRFLYSAFDRFFREELMEFLQRYGVECKTEPDGKVYPVTDNARDIVRVFEKYLNDGKTAVRYGVTVNRILTENNRITGVDTSAGIIPASAVILAAGGASHPQTGSTGDGYKLASALGHLVVGLRPGLVPLVIKETGRAVQMQGASLRNVRLTAFQKTVPEIDDALVPKADAGRGLPGKPPKSPVVESRTGDAIITHFGLSGPIVLEMSLSIIDALEKGPVSVAFDLVPDKNRETLRKELQDSLDRYSKRTYRNFLKELLPPKLAEPYVQMTGIHPDKLAHQITAEERETLLSLMKSLRFEIKGAYSMATAMVTAGGVSLKEIDPRTMASRIVDGLYLCGEVMDIDAGTGGYNLQAAFSTGYVAGESAARNTIS